MTYEESLKRTLDILDSLKGAALESRLSRKLPPLVSREFNVRRIRTIWTPEIIAPLGSAKEF